ncbi:threonine synthase, partial [Escherichia coli]|nr:threonine synthase [Escherichia coli]
MGSIPTAPAMAAVVKWLTHRIVVPTFEGSI